MGIDLGGSHVAAAVVDAQGRLRGRAERAVDAARSPADLVGIDVAGVVREAAAFAGVELDAVLAVGLGVPGSIDAVARTCRFAPNLGWRDVPAADLLERALRRPVRLINDVSAQALGETRWGAGRGAETLVMISVGTGIGGAVVVGGRLLEGAHGAAGEIGHATVDAVGPPCRCGNRGCLEAFAGAWAIAAAARAAVERGDAPGLARRVPSLDRLDARVVAEAAAEGDAPSRAILAEAGRWLGIAAANAIATVDPQCIVIGGGVARAGELLLAPLRAEAARRTRMLGPEETPIVPADLGSDAGLLGAALRILQEEPCRTLGGGL